MKHSDKNSHHTYVGQRLPLASSNRTNHSINHIYIQDVHNTPSNHTTGPYIIIYNIAHTDTGSSSLVVYSIQNISVLTLTDEGIINQNATQRNTHTSMEEERQIIMLLVKG